MKAQIREALRRRSAMGKRKALEFQSFVREIKVRSKDDLRMEAIGRG
jgi:hypothetical protein